MMSFDFSARAGAQGRSDENLGEAPAFGVLQARMGHERPGKRSRLARFAARFVVPGAQGVAGLLLFAAASLFPGQAAAAPRLTLQSGGISRSAVVVEHERLKLRRRPLVIVLHPKAAGPRGHRHSRFEEIAESSKPVFLYPEALGAEWPVAAGPDADRDVKFLRDLVDHFVGEGVADPRKIYLIGESSGGVFAFRAVCSGVGRPIAALATLGAAMPADLASCAPPPLAFIAIDHVGDPRTPIQGGVARTGDLAFNALPADATLSIFARSASCGAKREERPLTERDSRGTPRVHGAILSYSGCKMAVELVQLERSGGGPAPGHMLGRSGEGGGAPAPEFGVSHKVWEFLKRSGA